MYQRFDGKLLELLRVAELFNYDTNFVRFWWNEALLSEKL